MKSTLYYYAPVELKCVNFGVDTFLVNFKFAGPDDKPNGDALADEQAALLDCWQAAARKEHKPAPTPLEYRKKTLFIRPHGSGVWSWLLFNEDVTLSLSYGSMNGGVFCQSRFASHLLWAIGPEVALVDLQAMLYDFTGHNIYAQASEIHICADIQGWCDGPVNWQEGFVTRVVNIRARPDEPSEQEQEGGLSPKQIRQLEEAITTVQPVVTTTHRRIATLDFGSHGSEIMGQIYDKSAEIKKSKKTFFEDFWRANGWDGISKVRRVEFRFRRKALASFELNEAYSVLAQVRLLWEYATQQWLRYVDLSIADSNKSRLPADCVWQCVQGAFQQDELDAILDPQGEQQARLVTLLEEKPQQVLEQAIALSVPVNEQTHEPIASIRAIQDSMRDEPLDVVRELARETVAALSEEQVTTLLSWLSPEPFREVRSSLVKRARRMARKKMCVSAFTGYLTSIMALCVDEVAEQPDLWASLVVAFEEVRRYNKERGRVHLEEVWKKRLAYGFVTAQQVDEERRMHGVDLSEEDWAACRATLEELKKQPTDVYLNPLGDVA